MNAAQLLEFLVSIPSISGNENEIATNLSGILSEEGFRIQREGNSIWFTLGKRVRPHLLLLSHLDTVPPCAGWNSDPFKAQFEDGKIMGLGANDAKGSVAAMILAAREIEYGDSDGSITFAFVADEERGGEGIRTIKPKLGHIDAAVVGEPTGLHVCTTQRGLLILRCTAHGKASHAAHAHLGENAIHKAARDISRLAAMEFEGHENLGATRAEVTQIAGGLARNQVPDRCEFFVDLRTTPNLDHATVADEIGAKLESEVAIHSHRYEPVGTNVSEVVVRAALEAANASAGIGSVTTSDWAFLKDIPAVKVGPGDTNRSHRPNEYLLLSELKEGTAFYSRFIHTYFRMAVKEVVHV
jgi:Acetylornithine deacetylase/Succinyl-diaminopimelate desuccinylase and related deacylases